MSIIRAATKMLSKAKGKVTVGGAVTGGMAGIFGYMAYNDARDEGKGVAGAVASGAMEAGLTVLTGGWGYAAYMAATELPSLAVTAAESYNIYGRQLARNGSQKPFQNSQFVDTQQAYTMRQAGMSLAQKSKYSLQQTMLGNEAKYMHR